MKGKFWRKALAAALALLIVSGSVPIKPISDIFGDMAITANAETTTSTVNVSGTDYTLFTGFTATAGTKSYGNFVDGNTSTKWRVMKKLGESANDFAGGTEDPAYVEFHADAPFIPKGYILTYDNSVNGNWKPTSWALKAKQNESDEWTTIHSSNSSLGSGSRFEIACNNDGDNMYQYFRFEIYDVGTTYQSILNELEFYGNTGFIHLTPKVATCTETGIKQECWYSNGKYFSDANGTTELDESAVVEPMKAHNCLHHEASATNTEYWQCSVCGKCFSDEACTNEISEAEALIGVFGAIADGRYTLTSQTYTLTDDVNTAGYIYVPEGVTATIDLNGHTIDRGLTSADNNGSVIIVKGTLTIKDSGTDGKVQGGYDAGDGYGYYTSCVKVLEGATFNLQGGTLIGRDQDYDYTVSVVENSYFTMAGGKITGGWNGVLAEGNVTLTGGEISGNNMGVRVGENFSISGNPVITNNTEANVNIYSWLVINVVGALTDGANIGITAYPSDNAPVTVTSGYGTYNSAAPDTYFTLDNDGQIQTSPFDYMTVVTGWNEDRNEVAVGTATRTVTFDMNGHGDAIDAVSLLSGYKVAEPTAPTADGWYFVGWFTDDACTTGNEWNFDNAVTSNMTLHALWTQEAIYSIILPENMVIVSTDKEAVGGKYPVGTVIKFKLSSADYVVEGDVKNGEEVLSADANGIYTVTMGDADLAITATVKKAVEPNKTLSGSDNYTANDGAVLTGSTSGTVTIASDAKITLSDVTITGGIVCEGTADITLVGTNSVSGATNKAGIEIGGSSTTLTIKGNGSLTANGGGNSAGIGLSSAWDVDNTGGNIVIEGGNITATGGSMGAGIGLGVAYDNSPRTITLGNITIKGGSVTATGGNQGKGIGTGYVYGLKSASNIGVGTITITTGIDRVEASSISESVTYKHGDTDVTSNASDYFAINGSTITLKEYNLTTTGEHGTITAKVGDTAATTAHYGDTVTLNVTPDEGYVLKSLTVKDADENEIEVENNQFNMPLKDVTITAEFEAIDYNINITAPTNGSITAKIGDTSASTAHYGDTVTLDVTPDTGYSVKSVKYNGTEATKNADGTYSFEMPAENVTVTAEIKRVYSDGIGEHLAGHSLSLNGNIGVNFYMELDANVIADEDAYMQFTLPNRDTPRVPVSEAAQETVGGKTYYVFKCNVAAKEMTDTIKAQMFSGGKSGQGYEYTVKEYADYLLTNTEENEEYEKAAPLVKAMLDYGSYAQIYFNHNAKALANDGTDSTNIREVDAATIDKPYDPEGTYLGDAGDTTFEGATLSLKSETTLSLYFKSSTDLSFECYPYEVEKNTTAGGYQIARIRGIKADDLDKTFRLNIKDVADSGSTQTFYGYVHYCPLTYCYNVLNGGSDDRNLQNVCRALYLYWQAANEYSK